MNNEISADQLKQLQPLSSMSDGRLAELAQLCFLDRVNRGVDPFRTRGIARQAVYLVRGELSLIDDVGKSRILVGGAPEARQPVGAYAKGMVSACALTDIELIRIDDDLLDIMATWDQLATVTPQGENVNEKGNLLADWAILSGTFSVNSLKYGAFSQLPSAHIEQLLGRFQRLEVRSGETIIREGMEGDYYYVVESGKCGVTRTIGGAVVPLAELKSGDAFGEEALVSDAKRNATVTMKTDGVLLRLGKQDFVELLREPLLARLTFAEARQKVADGGQWIDVRYPSEYQYDKLPGAVNIPLAEIRNAFGVLDLSVEYVVYCQSERRSSAAAFLLAQRGYRAFLLQGGLWGKN